LKGYTIGELKAIARDKGLHAFAIKGDLAKLREQLSKGRPVVVCITMDSSARWLRNLLAKLPYRIADWLLTSPYSHFVLAFGHSRDSILWMDPAQGKVSANTNDFLRMWSEQGNAMLLALK